MRAQFQSVTSELVRVLEQRFVLVQQMGALKRRLGLPVRDDAREAKLTEALVSQASSDIPPDALRAILRVVFDQSVQTMSKESSHRER